MAPHQWSRDPQAVARQLNAVNPDAQARLSFAVECVEGLHYLVDLDHQLIPSSDATSVLGHGWQAVDMAHVRWAAGGAITALDLCAAALGRIYCGITGDGWDLSIEVARNRREYWDMLTEASGEPSRWIAGVRGHHRYKGLLQLRHDLTHKVRPRSYSVRTTAVSITSDYAFVGSPPHEEIERHARAHVEAQAEAETRAEALSGTGRTGFPVGVAVLPMPVPEVLRLARDVATKHVEAFLALDLG